MLDRWTPWIGRERSFPALHAELRAHVRASGATAVGALLLTCVDESEFECTDAFRHEFAAQLLPRLKSGRQVPFRLAIPGARYEPGCLGIAVEHFHTAAARRGWLLLVSKLNTHVAVARGPGGAPRFGLLDRYGDASTYCGAIHAALDGSPLPAVRALEADLGAGGRDRLAWLRDPALVAPDERALHAAIVLAHLQAQRIAQDVDATPPPGRVLHLVLAGVTLNRPGVDTELLVAAHALDRRGREPQDAFVGLGDDPRRYELTVLGDGLRVREQDPARNQLREGSSVRGAKPSGSEVSST